MNVIKLVIKISIILLIISIILLPKSYASTIGETISQSQDFLSEGDDSESPINSTNLANTSSTIYRVLLVIAIIASVIIGAILGIQFILASADGKAKVSEALIPYIIGCFVAFGAFTIWGVVIKIGNSAEDKMNEGSGWITPPVSGYICDYCAKDIGGIPSGVFTGGRDYNCPNCGKKIVEKGNIKHAHK